MHHRIERPPIPRRTALPLTPRGTVALLLLALCATSRPHGISARADDATQAQVPVRIAPRRASPWRLPESILRETLASIDRAQQHLAQRQRDDGFWPGAAFPTCGPARGWLPQTDDTPATDPYRSALQAAEQRMEDWLGQPLDAAQQIELARMAALLRSAGERPELVRRAARRLAATSPDNADPAQTALLFEARGTEAPYGVSPHEWSIVIGKAMRGSPHDVATIAVSGWARLQRGADPRGQAARAHLRALRAALPFARAGAAADAARDEHDPEVSPEALWWVVRFLDELPPAVLFEENVPLDWRVRLADLLLRRQRRDPASGAGYWTGPGSADAASPEALTATTYALRCLLRITDERWLQP